MSEYTQPVFYTLLVAETFEPPGADEPPDEVACFASTIRRATWDDVAQALLAGELGAQPVTPAAIKARE